MLLTNSKIKHVKIETMPNAIKQFSTIFCLRVSSFRVLRRLEKLYFLFYEPEKSFTELIPAPGMDAVVR